MMKGLAILLLFVMIKPIYAEEITIWAEKFEPYGYVENGEIVGLASDIVRYIINDTGINVKKWTVAPWGRALRETQKSANSVLYTVVRRPEREDMFYWVGPVSDRNQYLYKLKRRKDVVVSSIEDAKKYKLGAVYGTAITELLVSKGLKPHMVPNHDQTVGMLLAGRLDLIVHLDYSMAYLAQKMGERFSQFEPVLLVDGSKKYYIAINKNSDLSIVERFQQSFSKLTRSGGLKVIQSQYLK